MRPLVLSGCCTQTSQAQQIDPFITTNNGRAKVVAVYHSRFRQVIVLEGVKDGVRKTSSQEVCGLAFQPVVVGDVGPGDSTSSQNQVKITGVVR